MEMMSSMYQKDVNKVLENLVMNNEVDFNLKVLNVLSEIIECLELNTQDASLVVRYLKERSEKNIYNRESPFGLHQSWEFYLEEYSFYVTKIISVFPLQERRRLMFPEDIIEVCHKWTQTYQEEKRLMEKITLKTIGKQLRMV